MASFFTPITAPNRCTLHLGSAQPVAAKQANRTIPIREVLTAPFIIFPSRLLRVVDVMSSAKSQKLLAKS